MKQKIIFSGIGIFLLIGAGLEYVSVSLGVYTGVLLFFFYLFLSSLLWSGKSSFIFITLFTLVLEAVGLATSFPFGQYTYGTSVSWLSVLGVPLFIPLAWFVLISATAQIARNWYLSALFIIFIDIVLEYFATASGLWVWVGHKGFLAAPIQNYFTWGLVGALTYFSVKRDNKYLTSSYMILSMLLCYMAAVIMIHMLK